MPSTTIAGRVFRSDPRPPAEVFVLPLRAPRDHCGSRRARAGRDRRPRRPRKTVRISWSSAAAGARSASGWREKYPHAQITAVSNSPSQRRLIEAEARRAGSPISRHHRRHERFRGRRPVRPHRLGGDVRAYVQLARAAEARARLAEAEGGFSCTSSRIAPRLHRFEAADDRLDRPAFLHRRHDAEPRLIRQFPDLFRGRGGMALERGALSRTAQDWLRNFDRTADEVDALLEALGATPPCGGGAGGCSSSPPPACSATGAGRWGVSHYRLKPSA